jgi:dolichol kinase
VATLARPSPVRAVPPPPGRIRRELGRKAIHVASVVVPAFVWFAPRPLALAVLGAVAAVALAVDVSRLRFRGPRYRFLRLTRPLLRGHERKALAGATWMALAYFAATAVFPVGVAVAAMLFNALGDAAAAVVGRRWGRHRTRSGKSWEGFAAGLGVNAAAAAAVAALPGTFPLAAGLAGAAAAALLEMADLPLDDNVRVTLGGGAGIVAAALLLG